MILWQKTKQALRERLSESSFNLWIEPLQWSATDDKFIELAAPDRFFCSWVAEHYLADIKHCLCSVSGKDQAVRFTVVSEAAKPQLLPGSEIKEQLRLPNMPPGRSCVKALHPRYTFDEFMVGEANMLVTLLTPDLGLVRARAQGLRRSGAKLATSLKTFAESDVVLVRGKDSWRIAGAVLVEDWFARLGGAEPRMRTGRICSLLLRLVAGETHDPALFTIIRGFFDALATFPEVLHESAEILAALRVLRALGLDAGEISSAEPAFAPELLAEVTKNRTSYISRINNSIDASGL